MSDLIERYFMERIDTHLWVLEHYQMNPEKYCDDEPPYNVLNPTACMITLNTAKNYMKMLNKYQKMKNEYRMKYEY